MRNWAIIIILIIIGLLALLYKPSNTINPCQQITNKKIANVIGILALIVAAFFVIRSSMKTQN